MQSLHTPKAAPRSYSRRGASLEALIFKMGGINGATRRIVYSWNRPFTINQLKIALRRKYPALIPGNGQIEDILERMLQRDLLVRLGNGLYQRREILKEAA